MPNAKAPIEIFCSYALEDQIWFEKLETHLSLLKRRHLISTWHKRLVLPGTNWKQDMDWHLNSASVILLLISADFLASDYCYGSEMQRALQRQASGEVQVLPILVRTVDWTTAPFAHLQVLPKDGLPITKWPDEDEAWTHVVTAIRRMIEDLSLLVGSVTVSRAVLSSGIWSVSYPRNPFFTGRDDLLSRLHTYLQAGHSSTLFQTSQAISGLGGIGKTELAVEYAYRYRQDYQAIFWVRADTHEAIVSGYVALAQNLNLPEKDEKDQTAIVQAVLHWLSTHTEWLLILDNIDDLAVLEGLLPSEHRGHLLLTTRAQALGTLAHPLEVATMPPDIGATLLLRRARLIATDASLDTVSPADVTIACAISEELGGLPLALDQAGAYIEESRCSLARYQSLYRLQPSPLLKRRGGSKPDYPASVATTWSLSFEKVEQQNPMAAELLRCCAFMHPDTIPEELFTAGVAHLGAGLQQMRRDPLAFDEALSVLLAYSLIHRDPTTTTLSIHRLVQAILRDAMPPKTRKLWRERVIRALNQAFPEKMFEEWTICGYLLPHVLVCLTWIEQGLVPTTSAEAHLLHKAGNYLRERGQYKDAEPLLTQALAIHELHRGADHPDTATSLNSLARLYRFQGKYREAEPLLKRALAIREQQLGTDHLSTATTLNHLAGLYRMEGKYLEAESLLKRALAIREQRLGFNHPDTAQSLNSLAYLYLVQGKYAEAEPLYMRALSIREQQLGPMHLDTATSFNNLALLREYQGNYAEAEALYKRAIAIYEHWLGETSPETARILNNLAALYRVQGKYEKAEPLCLHALAINEQHLGANHPDTASSLNNLAMLYQAQGKHAEAEPLCLRALAICEQQLGTNHSRTAQSLNNLAMLYQAQGKHTEAEPLYLRALAICEQQLGADHPDTASSLQGLADLYLVQGKYKQAEVFYQRTLVIREQRLGPTHPDTQSTRNAYARFLHLTGRDTEATMLDISHKSSAAGGH